MEVHRSGELLKISWRTYVRPETGTILKRIVTCHQRTLLSRIEVCQLFNHKHGDKFISKRRRTHYGMAGVILTKDNELAYLLKQEKIERFRFVSPTSLKRSYNYIDLSQARFSLIQVD
jgi:hypothetical protein